MFASDSEANPATEDAPKPKAAAEPEEEPEDAGLSQDDIASLFK